MEVIGTKLLFSILRRNMFSFNSPPRLHILGNIYVFLKGNQMNHEKYSNYRKYQNTVDAILEEVSCSLPEN